MNTKQSKRPLNKFGWLLTNLNRNKMLQKLNTQNGIITRQTNGHVYSSPAHIPDIQLCNIPCSINIRIKRMPTIFTLKESRMSDSIPTMAPVTFFRGVGRININNPNSFTQSFVFDKTLELFKSPLVDPFVVSGSCSNITQILHNNNIPFFQFRDNGFADIVISPTHKPVPDTGKLFEFSFRCPCAFALEFTNKPISFNSQGFCILTIKFIIRSNSDFINPQVHTQNPVIMLRSFGCFFEECKSEIIIVFGFSEQTLSDFPIKIIQSIIRNLDRNFNSSLNGGDTQDIIFERETTGSIIPNRNFVDNGIRFCFLNHPTGLFNTRNRKLRWQTHLSQIFIDKGMELNIISNLHTPSDINTMLKSLLVEFDSSDNQIINLNFNWNTSQHKKERNSPFINFSNHYIMVTELNMEVAIPLPIKMSSLLAMGL